MHMPSAHHPLSGETPAAPEPRNLTLGVHIRIDAQECCIVPLITHVSCDSFKHGQARQLEERRRMSLPGVSTDPESDGAVGIDHAWKSAVEKAMKDTPLAASLIEAIHGMRDLDGKVDVDLLEDIVKGKREEWVDFIYSPAHTHTHAQM